MAWRCAGLSWPQGARMPVLRWEGGPVSPLTGGKELGFRAEGRPAVCRGARECVSVRGRRRRAETRARCAECARLDRAHSVAADTIADDPGRTASISPGSGPAMVKVGITAESSAGPRGCWSRGPSPSAGWGAGR